MRIKDIFIHLAIWALGVSLIFLPNEDITINYFKEADGNLLIPLIYGTIFNMVIFYGHTHVLIPRFLAKNLYRAYLGRLISLFFIITLFESWIDDFLVKMFYPEKSIPFWSEHFGVNAFFHLFILIASYTYKFSIDWNNNRHLQIQLKEEKLSAELALLKSQIHPHFLFNTLNNLFALARKEQAFRTADGITRLAELMRYMIYEMDVEVTTLEKEVAYLQNYISLQSMRFDENDLVDIIFECDEIRENIIIAPMLLVAFVENAFKHGISLEKTSYIHVYLKANDGNILFSVKNSLPTISTDKKDMGSGIGLINIRKRLEILYPSRHQLEINENENDFEITLIIDLL